MAAKGITYDLIAVDTANPPEDLLLLAPHYHSVPTLVERDNAIYISNVIAEYLDERYPHPALMPAEPIFRAMHRIAVRQVEHDWVPQVQLIQSGSKLADQARKRLRELILESLPFFKVICRSGPGFVVRSQFVAVVQEASVLAAKHREQGGTYFSRGYIMAARTDLAMRLSDLKRRGAEVAAGGRFRAAADRREPPAGSMRCRYPT